MYCYSPVFNRATSNLQPCLHWDKTSVASSNVRHETSLGKLILLRKTMRMEISGLSAVLTEWQYNPISKKFSFSIWLLLHLENNNSHGPLYFLSCVLCFLRDPTLEKLHMLHLEMCSFSEWAPATEHKGNKVRSASVSRGHAYSSCITQTLVLITSYCF